MIDQNVGYTWITPSSRKLYRKQDMAFKRMKQQKCKTEYVNNFKDLKQLAREKHVELM